MSTHAIFRVPHRREFGTIVTESGEMEKPWLLADGSSYAALFPAGTAEVELDADHRGSKLADFVHNSMKWLIVSERVRDILSKEPIQLELLPLGILDKKRKRVDRPFFIANLLGVSDCVDLQASTFVRSSVKPERVHTFNKLVLDPARIPPDATLFRIKEQPTTMIIRSDLVERLRAAGIDGFELWELNAPIVL